MTPWLYRRHRKECKADTPRTPKAGLRRRRPAVHDRRMAGIEREIVARMREGNQNLPQHVLIILYSAEPDLRGLHDIGRQRMMKAIAATNVGVPAMTPVLELRTTPQEEPGIQ